MTQLDELDRQIRITFNRSYALVGRGTTALWLALKAIAHRDGCGEVIVPDMLCSTVLDGILLAGFTPVFAPVTPDRFTIAPDSIAALRTKRTRAVIVAHLFGHVADMAAIRAAAPDLPIIEDAVQGFGGHYQGQPIGTLGDLSFVSFDVSKMVSGRGGLLLFNEGWNATPEQLTGFAVDQNVLDALGAILPTSAARGYYAQLQTFAPSLITPFMPSGANIERIICDWNSLPDRVGERNQKAHYLQEHLADLPISLPSIQDGDAIWRYSFAVPTVAQTKRIIHAMQRSGIRGSSLYYPLSQLVGGARSDTGDYHFANRIINLWVDEHTAYEQLDQTIEVIRGTFK